MTYVDQSDGITYLSPGESWRVWGWVAVRIETTFESVHDHDTPEFCNDLMGSISIYEKLDEEDITDLEIKDMEGKAVTAAVTLHIPISFETSAEPSEPRFEEDLKRALDDVVWDEYELLDADRLEFEVTTE